MCTARYRGFESLSLLNLIGDVGRSAPLGPPRPRQIPAGDATVIWLTGRSAALAELRHCSRRDLVARDGRPERRNAGDPRQARKGATVTGQPGARDIISSFSLLLLTSPTSCRTCSSPRRFARRRRQWD